MPTDTRQRILDTARRLFWEQGFTATGIAQILAEADVRSGSLYYFFPTKEDLLLAVLEHYGELLHPMVVQPVFERVADPIERIFGILGGYRRLLSQTKYRHGCPIGNLALEVGNDQPAARKVIAANFTGWRQVIEQCLADAADRLPSNLDRGQLALFVLTTMEGAVMLARTYHSLEPYDAAVSQLRQYFDRLSQADRGRSGSAALPRLNRSASMRMLTMMTLAATLSVAPRLAAADVALEKLKPIDLEVLVRGSLPDVWKAWTTNDGVRQWFAPGSNIDLRIGGPYEIFFSPEAPAGQRGAEDLKVLAFLPQELLAFEWNAPPNFNKVRPHRARVVVRFADLGGGTVRVRLTNAGFREGAAAHPDDKEEWVQVREYFSKAWPFVLESCRKHFAKTGGDDVSRQLTEGIVEAPLDSVWTALTTKEGWESWNVAHCEFDLRVGGKIRSHYDSKGVIGDPDTIENVILAYEPQRMYAIRVGKPPEKFPFKEAVKNVWHVITVEDAGNGRTRVRVTGLGYGADENSQKMRKFFQAGNAYTLKKLQDYFAKK